MKEKLYKADYNGGSILNLMASLENSMGGKSKYKELKNFDKKKVKEADNVVLIVLDGLGYELLMKYGKNSIFTKYLNKKLTSVFNPATSSAIPTFYTGLPPEQHEMTGWHMFVKEIGTQIIPLRFISRITGESLGGDVDIRKIFNIKPFSNKIKRKSYIVNPNSFSHSDFNLASAGKSKIVPYNEEKIEDFFNKIKTKIKRKEKKYIYAYYPNPDSLIHQYGSKHKKVISNIKKLEREFKKFLKQIKNTNTLIIITADHGLDDVKLPNRINVTKHPKLQECLSVPLCGDGKLGFAYVKPSKIKQFEKYCKTKLKKQVDLYKNTDFVKKFGLLKHGSRFLDRIGDYVMVLKEHYKINDYLINSEPSKNISTHGGFSKQEMFVPLILVDIKEK